MGFAISRTGWPGKFADCSLVAAVWYWSWRRDGCRVTNRLYLPVIEPGYWAGECAAVLLDRGYMRQLMACGGDNKKPLLG